MTGETKQADKPEGKSWLHEHGLAEGWMRPPEAYVTPKCLSEALKKRGIYPPSVDRGEQRNPSTARAQNQERPDNVEETT